MREAHCSLQFSLKLALVLALKKSSFIHFIGVNTMITRFGLGGEVWRRLIGERDRKGGSLVPVSVSSIETRLVGYSVCQ